MAGADVVPIADQVLLGSIVQAAASTAPGEQPGVPQPIAEDPMLERLAAAHATDQALVHKTVRMVADTLVGMAAAALLPLLLAPLP